MQDHTNSIFSATDVVIVVVDNGFVYVGNVSFDSGLAVCSNGFNVRKAGTTNGYGQLATQGPQRDSELDPCPIVLVPLNRVVHYLRCDNSKWAKKIKG